MDQKGIPKGPYRRSYKPTTYAGQTTCLRCEKPFHSWDRRQNRLCPRCWNALEQEPSEETPWPFYPPGSRSTHRDDG